MVTSTKRARSRRRPDGPADAATPQDVWAYVPYVLALRALQERLDATAEELAAWIFMGPQHGGLAAYSSANELAPAPRFWFDESMGKDYLGPMAACWFREQDIESFEPADRFVTGAALLTRWAEPLGAAAAGFIQAKIQESRLIDLHPTFGGTRADTADDSLPALEEGLFVLAHVAAIESAEFGWSGALPIGPAVGSREWRSQNARAAAYARHSKPGASHELQERMREIWASGKYTSRDRCAEQECDALGIACSTARKALTGAPDPVRT